MMETMKQKDTAVPEEVTGAQVLTELLESSRKEVKYSRIFAFVFAGILVLLVITVAAVVPRALNTLRNVDAMVENAQEILGRAEGTLDEVSEMTDSITKTSNLAFDSMDKVDFDELNQAIMDLKDAVEPMANFARRFR